MVRCFSPLTTDNGPLTTVPYGQERWSDGAAVTDFGFTGQRHEAGFGLMDYNARYYDPLLGRFISPDTIVPNPINPHDFNRYTYPRNNPLRYTDPTGHSGGDVIQGFLYEFSANNYDALFIPPTSPLRQGAEALAADQTDNIAFQTGRAIGGLGNLIQSAGEIVQGGTLFGGGLLAGTATLETVIGPVVGHGVAAVGAAEMAHGAGVAANGVGGIGESAGNIYNAITGSGSGKGFTIGPKWKPFSVTDSRFATGCEDIAEQIQKHISGDIYQLTPDQSVAPGSKSLGPIDGYNTGWGYHEVVVKDGRVYDAFTGHQGQTIEKYIQRWEYGDAIKWTIK